MPFILNDIELIPGEDIVIDDVRYPGTILNLWTTEELAEIGITFLEPEVVPLTDAEICAEIDAERDRRIATDFVYDFDQTLAQKDDGTFEVAGLRALQMSPSNRADWQTIHGLSLAAIISGSPEATIPMRCGDNVNVLTTAPQVLAALGAATIRGSTILFFAATLKARVRNGERFDFVNENWPQ